VPRLILPDTGHGSQDRYVSPLKAFSRCLLDFAKAVQSSSSFARPHELTIHSAQASDKRAQVDAGRFSNALRDFDSGVLQNVEDGLRTHATNAMLFE
jgi:hypothetical protein